MIGHPVEQTKLPDWFNEHASGVGLEQHMARIDVAPAELAGFVAEVRTRDEVVGLVSTIPHKAELARLVDEQSACVDLTGVCNAVRRDGDGRLYGDMLDGLAMCDALESGGVILRDADVTIAGCGAAGRAIAHEMSQRGIGRIELRDVEPGLAEVTVESLRRLDPTVDAVVIGPDEGRGSILVNASPAGMYDDSVPFGAPELAGARVVADAVTTRATPLLIVAADRGYVTVDGAQMAEAQLGPLLRLLSKRRPTIPRER
jgi:shikimate dehydrogenase